MDLMESASAAMNILIADDHPMFRWGVRQFISSLSGFTCVGEVSDGDGALKFIQNHAVDLVLLDIEMPYLDGVGFLTSIGKLGVKKPKILILSQTFSESFCKKLQSNGIDGYILKTEGITEIAQALSALQADQVYFSPGIAKNLWDCMQADAAPQVLSDREYQVAKLMSQGQSTKSIADSLGCAPSTVKTHRTNLMRKIDAKNSAEVARWVTSAELKL